VNIESPELCHPLTPLVVPKVHTVTPTAGSELFKSGGESDGGAESGESLFLQEGVSGSEGGIDERTNVGKDSIGDGAQILVHHYLAASMYRREMADFLSGMFGLEKDKLLGRMEMLAKRAAKKIKNKVAPGKPHYTASFLR